MIYINSLTFQILSDIPKESEHAFTEDSEQMSERPRENGHVPKDTPTNFKGNGMLPSFLRDNFKLQALKQQTKHLKTLDDHIYEGKLADNVNSEWRDISNVLDRLFLVLYLLIFVITTLSFLLQCIIQ